MTATMNYTSDKFIVMNNGADFWYYDIGVNVIPYNTQNRIPLISSYTEFQNNPIPIETFEQWKREGKFENGIAIILGKIWQGHYQGQYIAAIDCDNKKAS